MATPATPQSPPTPATPAVGQIPAAQVDQQAGPVSVTAATPLPTPAPTPIPTPTPSDSFDVVPDAEAASRTRQEAENARRYAAERARQQAEVAEREAFRKRQEAAAALFEQPVEAAPTPTPPPGQVQAPTDSGRWGPAPTPTPAPSGPVAPSAQLPGAAEAKRFAPKPSAPHAPPKPGDLVCGSCGAGNDPARKFCRQCGASLVAAVVEPRLPWWKRFFGRSRKKVPPPRPTGPGRPTKKTQRKRTTRKVLGYFRMAAALIAVAGVLGIAAIPALRTKVTDFASCKKQQLQAVIKPPVRNVALRSASSSLPELPEQPVVKAFDSNPATFWLAPPSPPPPAPPPGLTTLTVEFFGPSTVRQIHFFPGLPKAKNPNSQPTPKTVVLTFKNDKGQAVGNQERFNLETNVAKEDQLLKVKAKKEVQSVEVAILDTFASQNGGTQVAVSDVQFFGSPAPAPGAKCKVS